MNISPISFGKIIKVNAPYEIAKQIEDIANGNLSKRSDLNKSVNNLFDDILKGKAHTFNMDRRTSYIFSGEAGNKYLEAYSAVYGKFIDDYKNKSDKDEYQKCKENANATHRESVMNLINYYGVSFTLDPIYKNNRLKSLNILA